MTTRLRLPVFFPVLVIASICATAPADGLIVPVRPEIRVSGHWAVDFHRVDIRVRDQVAAVSIDQQFRNTGAGMIEVEYLFPVPPDAAIDSMTLLVNGKEFAARLLKADEARKIYEDIVRKKKDPALLEYSGFGLYRTRAFPLEADKPARVQVTYKCLCKKDNETVEVWYPLNTEKFSAKKISDVRITTDIKTDADISTIYSPSHEIKCDRKGSKRVIVTYEENDVLPTTDFQVFYKAGKGDVGATLLTHMPEKGEDGYFLLLVSPNPKLGKEKKVVPKDVVIVFDHSGSMTGTKIRQAKAAVEYIILRLNDGDRFNVIPYSDAVEPLFKKLMPAGKKNFKTAIDDIDRIDAGGGTAIHAALQQAMKQWKGDDEDRPKYIIFLTDGKPTIGKTHIKDILRDTKKANTCGARLFAFGVGYDVNIKLLDKLVIENSGRSDYVKPRESVESKISSLYNKIKNPVVTGLSVDIEDVKTRDCYPRELGDLFDGDQIVLTGRYSIRDNGKASKKKKFKTQLLIEGRCRGKKRVFEYNVALRGYSKKRGRQFVEKIWAVAGSDSSWTRYNSTAAATSWSTSWSA